MKTPSLLATAALLAAVSLTGCVLDWSPDGSSIVMVWSAGSASGKAPDKTMLAIVKSDAGGVSLLKGTEGALYPAWAPSGKSILCAGQKARGNALFAGAGGFRTLAYDIETSTARVLADGPGPPYSWSTDSQQAIGIREFGDQKPPEQEVVWTGLKDGAISRRLRLPVRSVLPAEMLGTNRIKFVDGTRFVYLGEDAKLHVADREKMDTLPSREHVIGFEVLGDMKLAWVEADKAGVATLCLYDFSTKNEDRKKLPEIKVSPEKVYPLFATVSPTGAHVALVAMTSNKSLMDISGTPAICVYSLAANGTEPVQIRRMDIPRILEPSAMLFPRWSPNGRRLAVFWIVESGRDNVGLMVCDPNGGNKKVLVSRTIG